MGMPFQLCPKKFSTSIYLFISLFGGVDPLVVVVVVCLFQCWATHLLENIFEVSAGKKFLLRENSTL